MVISMELNFKEMLHLLLRKWWLILLCAIIIGIGAYFFAANFTTPVYEANTTIYVGKNADQAGVDALDLNIGAAVVLDYREIAKSRLVASTVIKELELTDDLSVGELIDRINVEQRTETRVIEISVMDYDPEMAMIITNKTAEVFKEKIAEIMQIENVQVIDVAELPTSPVTPGKRTISMIGSMLGLIIGVVIVFLIEYFDNTIKTPEDVKKYLGLPVIGTIPAFKADKKGI